MGCFFSQCRSSLILDKSGTMPPNTCVQRLDQNHTNGIIRVPKGNHDHDNTDEPPTTANGRGTANGRSQLKIRPPPPAPPPSPPKTRKQPQHTTINTTEDDYSVLNIQDAEELHPVSPLQVLKSSSSKSHKQSSITVSDVNFNQVGLKRTSSTRREEELSVEELDSDTDDYSRISDNRNSQRLNPPTTDILLPRRKDGSGKKPTLSRQKVISKSDGTHTGQASSRRDTPIPQRLPSKYARNLTSEKTTIGEDTENKPVDNFITIDDETNETDDQSVINSTKITSNNKTQLGNKTHNVYTIQNFEQANAHNDKESEPKKQSLTITVPIMTPKDVYDKQLEKKRQNRKRKRRGINKSNENIPGKLNDNGMPSSVVKDRPYSGSTQFSVNSIDSKQLFGSNDSLKSFDMETTPMAKSERYSYIQASTTPISFKALTMYVDDEQAEIIDLEDDNGDSNNSWLDDDRKTSDKPIDDWYGVNPYRTVSSKAENDLGVITEMEREPSQSDILTKKKLLYSRYSRRPQSETLLRSLGKPPLPPGAVKKTRPTSDTGQRTSQHFSRYYTNDLDIH